MWSQGSESQVAHCTYTSGIRHSRCQELLHKGLVWQLLNKELQTVYTGTLNPGASTTLKIYYKYYRGTVKVDYYNRVAEKSETNNLRKF